MHKFFSNRKLIILLIVIIVSMGLMAYSVSMRNRKSATPLVQQFGNDIVGLADRVVAAPASGIKGGVSSIATLMNTYEENAELKRQVDDLAQAKVQNQTLKAENKELKKQLKLNKTLTDYSPISAAVLTRSPSAWQNNVVINRGATSGIKKNMPVMVGSGLVGRVIEVNQTNSKVQLISTDNQSANRFAANVTTKADKTVNGVISGYDETTGTLTLSQLNTDDTIEKGDTVATSGLGGVTPKGLFVGKVTKVKHDEYDLARSVSVQPAADLNNFSVVTVINREVGGD